ncbi:MAG: family 78 glycoside hydrolase catalytic domain [Ruminococcus sp.]|nr:family 78 glycoside hydrolase catalytic domain [Ruminococcus sp.]
MEAIHLQTEYLTEPIGLGITAPRFYWNCEGGVTQTAYRITVKRGDVLCWDSGKVSSSSMTHIPYQGMPLQSRDILDWSVQLWDESDVPGGVSTSSFEMGLLCPGDWSAKWISGDYKPKKNTRYPVDCFKKSFSIPDTVIKARLYATARGIYDVTVNGHRIEDFILAPGVTDYRKRIQYQTYDVTEYITKTNTIELRLADGWYRGSVAAYGVVNVFGMQTSVVAQLELTLQDGSVKTVVTDESWAWSNDGPIRFADLKDGEIYQAGLIPSYSGKARETTAPENAVICASNNVPVREMERFTPTLLIAEDGTRVLDFGQNIAGYPEFTVNGEPGTILHMIFGEVLDDSGHIDMRGIQETRPAKGWNQISLIKKLLSGKVSGKTDVTPKQEIVFTCSGEEDHYKNAFTVFGFRYAELVTDMEIDPKDFASVAVYSDMEETGSFTCSDERVNKLVENTKWSMKGNFLDIPTDCPTRERLGWTGDAQLFFDTGAYLMNTAPFFRKWLSDIQDNQYANGLISSVIPYSGVEMMYKSTGSSVGWADAVYLIPWRYYLRFGDETLLRENWPMIRKYAEYLMSQVDQDGHYEKGIHLGEWLEPEEFRDQVYGTKAKHPEECTAYLYYSMKLMAEIAGMMGEGAFSAKLTEIAGKAKSAYPRYAELDTDRQAKLVRPLALGLLTGEEKKKAQKRLSAAVEHYHYRVGTGFLSTPFLLSVLTEAGDARSAYKMLLNPAKPGWLAPVVEGDTTLWEDWEGDHSRNHYAIGAVCQWLFDTVCGIRADGENHFVIAPVPGGELTHAEAGYQSLYGRIESRWKVTDKGTEYTITVPPNTTAEIQLPGERKQTVTTGIYTFVR